MGCRMTGANLATLVLGIVFTYVGVNGRWVRRRGEPRRPAGAPAGNYVFRALLGAFGVLLVALAVAGFFAT